MNEKEIEFIKQKGTKDNIQRYRDYCLKHDCLATLPFLQYMKMDGLEKYIK